RRAGAPARAGLGRPAGHAPAGRGAADHLSAHPGAGDLRRGLRVGLPARQERQALARTGHPLRHRHRVPHRDPDLPGLSRGDAGPSGAGNQADRARHHPRGPDGHRAGLDQPVTRELIAALWLAWLAYWIIAAGMAKPVERRETPLSRAVHVVPLTAGAVLMAWPHQPHWLFARFMPPGALTGWLGVAILAA